MVANCSHIRQDLIYWRYCGEEHFECAGTFAAKWAVGRRIMLYKMVRGLLAATVVAMMLGGTAMADTILPQGLAPGSQYEIAFVTADITVAESSSIATYNSFVTSEANQDGILKSLRNLERHWIDLDGQRQCQRAKQRQHPCVQHGGPTCRKFSPAVIQLRPVQSRFIHPIRSGKHRHLGLDGLHLLGFQLFSPAIRSGGPRVWNLHVYQRYVALLRPLSEQLPTISPLRPLLPHHRSHPRTLHPRSSRCRSHWSSRLGMAAAKAKAGWGFNRFQRRRNSASHSVHAISLDRSGTAGSLNA